jgi:hypothetical protein
MDAYRVILSDPGTQPDRVLGTLFVARGIGSSEVQQLSVYVSQGRGGHQLLGLATRRRMAIAIDLE